MNFVTTCNSVPTERGFLINAYRMSHKVRSYTRQKYPNLFLCDCQFLIFSI